MHHLFIRDRDTFGAQWRANGNIWNVRANFQFSMGNGKHMGRI